MDIKTIEELERLDREATEHPWSYELVGDKCNDWCIGHCVDAEGKPVAGEIVEPYDEDTGEFGEKPVVIDSVCESSDNIQNAAFIVDLRNAAPELLRLAREHAEFVQFIRAHGPLAVRILNMAQESTGFARDFGGVDTQEKRAARAFVALVERFGKA